MVVCPRKALGHGGNYRTTESSIVKFGDKRHISSGAYVIALCCQAVLLCFSPDVWKVATVVYTLLNEIKNTIK